MMRGLPALAVAVLAVFCRQAYAQPPPPPNPELTDCMDVCYWHESQPDKDVPIVKIPINLRKGFKIPFTVAGNRALLKLKECAGNEPEEWVIDIGDKSSIGLYIDGTLMARRDGNGPLYGPGLLYGPGQFLSMDMMYSSGRFTVWSHEGQLVMDYPTGPEEEDPEFCTVILGALDTGDEPRTKFTFGAVEPASPNWPRIITAQPFSIRSTIRPVPQALEDGWQISCDIQNGNSLVQFILSNALLGDIVARLVISGQAAFVIFDGREIRTEFSTPVDNFENTVFQYKDGSIEVIVQEKDESGELVGRRLIFHPLRRSVRFISFSPITSVGVFECTDPSPIIEPRMIVDMEPLDPPPDVPESEEDNEDPEEVGEGEVAESGTCPSKMAFCLWHENTMGETTHFRSTLADMGDSWEMDLFVATNCDANFIISKGPEEVTFKIEKYTILLKFNDPEPQTFPVLPSDDSYYSNNEDFKQYRLRYSRGLFVLQFENGPPLHVNFGPGAAKFKPQLVGFDGVCPQSRFVFKPSRIDPINVFGAPFGVIGYDLRIPPLAPQCLDEGFQVRFRHEGGEFGLAFGSRRTEAEIVISGSSGDSRYTNALGSTDPIEVIGTPFLLLESREFIIIGRSLPEGYQLMLAAVSYDNTLVEIVRHDIESLYLLRYIAPLSPVSSGTFVFAPCGEINVNIVPRSIGEKEGSEKTEESEEKTEVPEEKTEVPEEKTEVPEEKTEVPEEKTEVPEGKTEVPEEKTEVPEEKTEVPEEKTVVPEEKTVVPEEKTEVPEEKTEVPEEKTVVPEEKTEVPEEKTVVPEEKTVVPEEKTEVPEEKTEVPEEKTEVPEENNVVPKENTEVPEENTEVPEEKTEVPEEKTVVPEETTEVPEEKTEVLEEKTEVPEEKTEVPEEKTVVPEETTEVPEEKTVVPEEKTEVPEEKTEVPEEKTEVPEENNVVPKENTEVPEENTEVPEEKTEVPEEKTEVPEEKTVVPEETTEVPEEKTVVPEEKTEVPEEKTEVPEEKTEVPEENNVVPKENTEVPEENTEVPEEKTEVPEEKTEEITEEKTKEIAEENTEEITEENEEKTETGVDIDHDPKSGQTPIQPSGVDNMKELPDKREHFVSSGDGQYEFKLTKLSTSQSSYFEFRVEAKQSVWIALAKEEAFESHGYEIGLNTDGDDKNVIQRCEEGVCSEMDTALKDVLGMDCLYFVEINRFFDNGKLIRLQIRFGYTLVNEKVFILDYSDADPLLICYAGFTSKGGFRAEWLLYNFLYQHGTTLRTFFQTNAFSKRVGTPPLSSDERQINFEVKADSDAVILLTSTSDKTVGAHVKIVLGAENNTESYIEANSKTTTVHEGLLEPTKYVQYWISFAGDLIQVGRVGERHFMSYEGPLPEIRFAFFESGIRSKGVYYYWCVSKFYYYSEARGGIFHTHDIEQAHQYHYTELRREGGGSYIEFKIRASGLALVAVSPSKGDTDGMLEIGIGGYGRREMFVRKCRHCRDLRSKRFKSEVVHSDEDTHYVITIIDKVIRIFLKSALENGEDPLFESDAEDLDETKFSFMGFSGAFHARFHFHVFLPFRYKYYQYKEPGKKLHIGVQADRDACLAIASKTPDDTKLYEIVIAPDGKNLLKLGICKGCSAVQEYAGEEDSLPIMVPGEGAKLWIQVTDDEIQIGFFRVEDRADGGRVMIDGHAVITYLNTLQLAPAYFGIAIAPDVPSQWLQYPSTE